MHEILLCFSFLFFSLRQVAMSVLVPITVIYVIMFITGVVGNIAVCFVIVKNRSMHTATNYYLFSLAASDLIILLLGRKCMIELQGSKAREPLHTV